MKRVMSFLLALVMALSLLPSAVWATEEVYDPFAGLESAEAAAFAEQYVYVKVYDEEDGDFYDVGLIGVDGNGVIFSNDRSKDAYDAAKAAYEGLSPAARAELDAVSLLVGSAAEQQRKTFAELMAFFDTLDQNTGTPYAPFSGLKDEEAIAFVREYVDYGCWKADDGYGYWLNLLDVWTENGMIEEECVAQAKAALEAYAALSDAAKAELNTVKVEDGGEEPTTVGVLMQWYQNCYNNTVDPFLPFAGLTNPDAIAFADTYLYYHRWEEDGEVVYGSGLKDVSFEENGNFLTEDTVAQAEAALDAYAALSDAARADLDTVQMRDWDGDTIASYLIVQYNAFYLQTVGADGAGTVTDPSGLSGAARSFLRRYMAYDPDGERQEKNIDVTGAAYYFGAYTDPARARAAEAGRVYAALPLAERAELEKLYVTDGESCNFSEWMNRCYWRAIQPATGTKTPEQLTDADAIAFFNTYIDYDAETCNVNYKGTKRTADGLYFTADTLAQAEAVQAAWEALNEKIQQQDNGNIWGQLEALRVCWDGTPVRFCSGVMDHLWSMLEETRYSPEYMETLLRNKEFKAPVRGTDFDVEFPQLEEGTDYTCRYTDGVLTVTVKAGDREHWRAASGSETGSMEGNVYFQLRFPAPQNAVKVSHDCGNGIGGVWTSYLEHTEYENAHTLQENETEVQNGRAIAAVNRDGDLVTVTPTGEEAERMVVSWFDENGGSLGRFVLGIRVVVEESFCYEFSDPAPAEVKAERFTTDMDGSGTWNVIKEDGMLTLRPKADGARIADLLGTEELVTAVTLTPPQPGYTIDWDKSQVMDGRRGPDAVWETGFRLYAFRQQPTCTYYTLVWTKDGAPDITEKLTAKVTERSGFMASIGHSKGVESRAAEESAVMANVPASGGMQVTYDPALGYFHTRFTGGAVPAVEDLQRGITLTPWAEIQEQVQYFRFVDFGSNLEPAYVDENETERYRMALEYNTVFDMSRAGDRRHLTVPYVQTKRMTLEDMTIYFAGSQLYFARVVEWLDGERNTLGYTYIYGKNDSVVSSVSTRSVTAPETAEDAPVIVGQEGLRLTCQRYPQAGGQQTKYMRLTVDDTTKLDPEGNAIYLPYSYFDDLDWEKAQQLKIRPVIRHYADGEDSEPEVLRGEYTAYGVKFVTKGFSPFTVTCRTTCLPGRPAGGETVEALDMAFTYEYLTGQRQVEHTSDKWDAMDVNGDGTVDVYDLQGIYEMASGLRDYE